VTDSIPALSPRPARKALCLLAALILFALPSLAPAQDQGDNDKKQFSEKVRDGLTKFGELQSQEKWDQALALIADLLKVSQPNSYDEYMLNYIKGQLYLRIDQTNNALAPFETALRVSDQQGFFDDKDERTVLKYLAQIYYGEGSAKGVNPVLQTEYFNKAGAYLNRLLNKERANKTTNSDDVLFYAYLLLNRAQVNPEKLDTALLKQAQSLSEEGLALSITPKPEFYRLLLSTLLLQNNYADAADIIELLLQKDPTNKENWAQLSAIYLSLGGDDKDKEKAREYNLRAILTFERAQALGQLKTPKDNYNLVGTYANIGQTEKAAELLAQGLTNGTIESDKNHWLYLAAWYQQLDKQQKAIDVMKEAAKHFPDSGEFDFMAAQNYWGLEKYEDALQEAKIAAAKGLGDKTWQAWQFIAYTAFQVGKYEEAIEAVDKALANPASKKDAQLPGVKEEAQKAINSRNAQTEALKAKQKL